MIYLLLAILSSALVSVIMRLSTDKVKNNISMLAMNYLMCLAVAAALAEFRFFPRTDTLGASAGMGVVHGILYLAGFILLQANIKKNGVVLSATFMKLGVLVPIAVSVFLFGETPGVLQLIGFAVALAGIVLINMDGTGSAAQNRWMLIVMLLAGGCGDTMSKVYEQWGDPALAPQFLLYTFATAFVLCTVLALCKKQRPGKNEVLYGLLIGVPNFFSARFLLMSLDTVPAVIAYPTFCVGTIIAVTAAGVMLFRERLTKRQWLALGAILAALVLLNS